MHAIRAHGNDGSWRLARSCAVGSVCPFCNVDVHNRIRLCRHLRHGAAKCVAASSSGLLPAQPPEEVEAANDRDRLERAARRKAGVRDAAGPHVIRGLAVV